MIPEIRITVRDGVAQLEGRPEIICGNSDYTAVFDLDSPWNAYEVRCARFVWRDLTSGRMLYADVLFEGDTAAVPPVYNTDLMLAGIYAGSALTSTPVRIPCRGCVTDQETVHGEVPADIYEQMQHYFVAEELIVLPPYEAIRIVAENGAMPQISAPDCISEPILPE